MHIIDILENKWQPISTGRYWGSVAEDYFLIYSMNVHCAEPVFILFEAQLIMKLVSAQIVPSKNFEGW